MDVDSADFAATAVATAEDDVQPIQVQRARRTYASKPKLTAVSNDERPSDLYSSSASGSLRTNAAAGPQSSTTTTTATSTYQPGHWRNLLAEIDKDSEMGSDDDKERLAAPRTGEWAPFASPVKLRQIRPHARLTFLFSKIKLTDNLSHLFYHSSPTQNWKRRAYTNIQPALSWRVEIDFASRLADESKKFNRVSNSIFILIL